MPTDSKFQLSNWKAAQHVKKNLQQVKKPNQKQPNQKQHLPRKKQRIPARNDAAESACRQLMSACKHLASMMHPEMYLYTAGRAKYGSLCSNSQQCALLSKIFAIEPKSKKKDEQQNKLLEAINNLEEHFADDRAFRKQQKALAGSS